MRVLVTGASGFVGRVLMQRCPGAQPIALGGADWRAAIAHADYRGAVVVHLAARVHEARASWSSWQEDNVDKTEALARAAARGGAARLAFASTIKVHGEETHGAPFRAGDALQPQDEYARSKALAEGRLQEVARETGLEIAIVRAPLVFGPGAKANLRRVLQLAASGMPLPFARIANRRSWIHVDDLCALLLTAGESDAASGKAMIAAHPAPFSTSQLLAGLRARMGRAAHLFALPTRALELGASVAGQGEAMRRLTRSLEGDPAESLALGWRPARDFDAAMDDLAAAR